MFWRGETRLPSRPDPHLTVAKKMYHPITMGSHDVFAQGCGAEDLAATPEYLPVPSDNGEDQIKTQATSPTPEVLSYITQEHTLAVEDDSIAFKVTNDTENRKHSALISVKARHSRSRLLTLLACVSYLLFNLLGVEVGVRLIAGYTGPRLHRAEVQLQAAMSSHVRERVLYLQLEDLLGTTLDRRFVESYEHCLARSLYQADIMFLGIDFTQFPAIRNQTMDWATDNCGKLLYTPQLLSPKASKYWGRTANNYRRYAEKAVSLFRHKATILRCWWTGVNPRLAAKPVVVELTENTAKAYHIAAQMPFGFILDCKGSPPCRLVYARPSDSTLNGTALKEALIKARKEVKKWSWPFDRVLHVSSYMTTMIFLLQLFLGYILLFAVVFSQPRPRLRSLLPVRLAGILPQTCNIIAQLQSNEQLALGLIINTALYALLLYQLKYITSEFDRPLLPVGAGFCAFHVPQILAFFDLTSEETESLRSVCQMAKELFSIAQSHQLPEVTSEKRQVSISHAAATSPDAKPASKIAARFVSPLTSILEDIQQERKAMHAQQVEQPYVDTEYEAGYATETDSDYDSDVHHTVYIDLPNGASTTVSDDGSDWSVLDD